MAVCFLCKEDVTSGFVVCGDCADKLDPKEMHPVMRQYIERLAEEIVNDNGICSCDMCVYGTCESQVSGLVCLSGVIRWLQGKANELLQGFHCGNILSELKPACPFPEVFEDVDEDDVPRRKIGHIRADHNGHRWWSSVWASRWELATAEIKAEIDCTYKALTAKDALADLNTLRWFCWSHPEAQFSPEVEDEFSFYLVGKTCDFWVRLILREKDYNIYLNAYAKADQSQEAQ